jgi:hypothetical protein
MKWVEANAAFVASSNISCITLAMFQLEVLDRCFLDIDLTLMI